MIKLFKKYFSGKLALVQILAGVGALMGRSAGAYVFQDQAVWNVVLASMAGSFAGYVGIYVLGYWLSFRKDYKTLERPMGLDIARLQLVEQSPNIVTFALSGLTQAALIGGTGLSPVLSANLASLFGPHKIINLVVMATSNSLKKAWVDGTWRPAAIVKVMTGRARRLVGLSPSQP